MILRDLLNEERTWIDVQQQYADDPEFLQLVQKAKQMPGIRTWDDAVDKASRLQASKTPPKTPKEKPKAPVQQPAAPAAKPEPVADLRRGSDDRVLRHQRYYKEPDWNPASKIGKAIKKITDPIKKGAEFARSRNTRKIRSKSKFIQR